MSAPDHCTHCSDICISTDSGTSARARTGSRSTAPTAPPVTRPSGIAQLLDEEAATTGPERLPDHDARAQTWQAAANLARGDDDVHTHRPASLRHRRAHRDRLRAAPAQPPGRTRPVIPRAPCPRHLAHLHAGTPKTTGGGDPAVVGRDRGPRRHGRILDGLPDWEAEIPVRAARLRHPRTSDAYHRPSRPVPTGSSSAPPPSATTRPTAPAPVPHPGPPLRPRARAHRPRRRPRRHRVHPRAGLSSGIHLWGRGPRRAGMRRRAAPLGRHRPGRRHPLGPAAAPTSGDARCDWCPTTTPRRHRPGHILRRHATPDRHRDRDGTHEWKGTTMSTFTSPQPHPQASPTPTTSAPPHHRSTALRADRRDQPRRQGRDRRDRPRRRPGTTAEDALLFPQSPRRIVEEPCRADRPRDPHPGVAKPGQSAPWTLTDATGDPAAVKRATDFLDAYKSGGLAAPEPAVDAATAAALKLLKDQGTRLTRQPPPATGGTGSRPEQGTNKPARRRGEHG